jgi:histidine triad (HIT) family protein
MGDPEACVFCAIIDGRAPAHVVHSDERTIAFLDINPATSGHTLVVPRVHARTLLDLDLADATAMMAAARSVAVVLDRTLRPEGLTLFQANEPAGWQTVFHVHLHVLPRWSDDGLVPPWTVTPGNPVELAAVAERIGRG